MPLPARAEEAPAVPLSLLPSWDDAITAFVVGEANRSCPPPPCRDRPGPRRIRPPRPSNRRSWREPQSRSGAPGKSAPGVRNPSDTGRSPARPTEEIYHTPGRFGWAGGFGTIAYTDPAEGMIGILFTQRMLDSPEPPKVFTHFWNWCTSAME